MQVEAIEHANVLGQKQKFLKITNTKGKFHLINIGDKTFKALTEMLKDEPAPKEIKK